MFPIGFLAEILIGFFIEMLGYSIARLVIPLITFGSVRIDPVSSSSEHYNWLGYRTEGAKLVLGPTLAGVIGVLLFIMLFVLLVVALVEPQ